LIDTKADAEAKSTKPFDVDVGTDTLTILYFRQNIAYDFSI
jgi:hypothetical protein